MRRNKVRIDVFKDTGKWHTTINFKTKLEVFKWEKIYQEFLKKHNNYKTYDTVIFISNKNKTLENYRVIINSVKTD